MPKIERYFTVGPEIARGILKLDFPFSRSINDAIKVFPGVRPIYEQDGSGSGGRGKFQFWAGPAEFLKEYEEVAHAHRLTIRMVELEANKEALPTFSETLLGHQVEAVIRSLNEGSHLVSFETGGGKTRVGIELLRIANPRKVLVVCPAAAKRVWQDEFEKWEPNLARRVGIVQPGKDLPTEDWVVVNYELLHKVDIYPWDVVICDELHYIASGGTNGSKRGRQLNEIARCNPDAYRIGLTATPIMTDPKQFYWQGDFLFPDRYGSYGHFMKRYSGKEENAYAKSGYKYEGLDPDNAKEFERRVGHITSRATAKEYGADMPSFNISTVRFQPPKRFNPEQAVQDLLAGKKDLADVVKHHTSVKLKFATEQIMDKLVKASHVIALTHYRDSAEQLTNALRGKLKDIEPLMITGSIPVVKRAKLIEEQRQAKKSVIVATMHSVKEAIDLTKYTQIIAVELYWSPGIMTQAFGRFLRLNSTEPAQVTILAVAGSAEENIATTLERRYSDQAAIIGQTGTEEKATKALGTNRTEEETLAYLSNITNNISFTNFALDEDDE